MKKLEKYNVNNLPIYDKLIERKTSLYERERDIRSPFNRDYTRIIFSTGFRRMKHKTQVFFQIDDDHVCTRNEHVNLVESVSSTIALELGLNTDLTRAISVGHDIGHAPFGHGGEKILNEIALNNGLPSFWHEKNSLRMVDYLEQLEDDYHQLHPLDLTYAVRDGIISHCGEVNQRMITPRKELIDLEDYEYAGQYNPMTYEGCVVKMSDKISYLARDIEDALHLNIITKKQVEDLKNDLNKEGYQFNAINNGSVINFFIHDVIENSNEKGIGLSEDAYTKMKKMMRWNYHNIYEIKKVKVHAKYVKLILNSLFEFLDDYENIEDLKKDESQYHLIISHYLSFINKHSTLYNLNDTLSKKQSILDYLSGMTDSFIIKSFNELLSF